MDGDSEHTEHVRREREGACHHVPRARDVELGLGQLAVELSDGDSVHAGSGSGQ